MSKETEPGTLPEGIEKLRREFVALTAREWPKTITPEVLLRLLDRLALDVAQTAYAEGAAQERARLHAGIIAAPMLPSYEADGEEDQRHAYRVGFTDAQRAALDALATRTPPPPEAPK